jgi:hypothetical protein
MEKNILSQRTKRIVLSGTLIIGAATLVGCGGYVGVVAYRPAPPPVVYVEPAPAPAPAVVVADGPVVTDPSVVVIDVEPDPAYRVYVYDPGYPPGCYFYGGFYYYGGYRYPHDVFVNRYVTVNIREHRFADRNENRQRGAAFEARDKRNFAAHRNNVKPAASHQLTPAQRGQRRSTGDQR